MSRFVDGVRFIHEGEVVPPNTSSQLFAELGVRESSEVAQRAAVHDWLAGNKPTPWLRLALECRGFIDAEGRPIAERGQGRSRPDTMNAQR
jgi:hypothetical protein